MYIRDYTNTQEEIKDRHLPGVPTGLAVTALYFPELVKLHRAGHTYLPFILGLAGFVLGIVLHYVFIYRRLEKKNSNLNKVRFVSDGWGLLIFALAMLVLFIRYKVSGQGFW